MLIIKGDTTVNMDQVFSMRLAGAGGRTLVFRGSDSLSAEMHFADKEEAEAAREKILTGYGMGNSLINMDMDLNKR